MVDVEKLKRGLSAYLDREIMPKLPGYKKWIFGAGATAYITQLGRIIDDAARNQALAPLGFFEEGGQIDIDAIYNNLKPVALTCDAPIEIPIVGKITLSATDVDLIYNYIING